ELDIPGFPYFAEPALADLRQQEVPLVKLIAGQHSGSAALVRFVRFVRGRPDVAVLDNLLNDLPIPRKLSEVVLRLPSFAFSPPAVHVPCDQMVKEGIAGGSLEGGQRIFDPRGLRTALVNSLEGVYCLLHTEEGR